VRHALFLLEHEPGLASQLRMAAARNCRTTLSSASTLDAGGGGLFLLHLFLTPRPSDDNRDSVPMGVDVLAHRVDADVHDPDLCRATVDAAIAELLAAADPLALEAPAQGFYLGGGLLLHRVSQTAAWISSTGGEETTMVGSSALLHLVDCSSVTLLVNERGELVQMMLSVPGTSSGGKQPANQLRDVAEGDGVATLQLPRLFSSDELHRLVRGLMEDH
jgi:hypothetical protein